MKDLDQVLIRWSDYLKYRAELRGFELAKIEHILRYSGERYFDTVTRRMISVGRHDDIPVIVPYEEVENTLVPITIHATMRQQINFRLKTGRRING